jgi:putative tryptophan/tyrosine transport system substrate-binding protein
MRRRDFIAGLGSTAAWPVVARAQLGAMPVIGYLGPRICCGVAGIAEDERWWAAFRRGLGEQGYVEGRNVEILRRDAVAPIPYDRFPVLAADLVHRGVAVIAAWGTLPALAAKKATSTIPIIFMVGTDPVQAGLVASLNRPGGNATGVTYLSTELAAKRLELLHEIAPGVMSIGYLYSSSPGDSAVSEPWNIATENAAGILGLRLVKAEATTPSEIERAFAMFVDERIGALLFGPMPPPATWRGLIALATHYALPAMYPDSYMVKAGGLVSYTTGNDPDPQRLAGTYVGRILKGEKPADLPVQQSTRFEMVLNLKTAKALGLTVPPSILLRADEVIE